MATGRFILPIAAAGGSTAGIRRAALLNNSGATTSYRTGDDGDRQRGKLVSHLVLDENNFFGNTDRFTDTAGGQTYANGIVIDHSTYNGAEVLCYYKGDSSTYRNWDTSNDLHLASAIGGLTGWYLWNIPEVINLCNLELKPYKMNYAPFNFGASSRYFHTANDYSASSTVYITDLGGPILTTGSKSSAYYGMYVRVCTVTGTTLS